MPAKQSKKEVQDKIDLVQNGRITIIGDYVNNNTPVLVRCNICGVEWKTTAKLLKKTPVGVNCNHSFNLTEDMVVNRIAKATNGTIKMLGKYTGAKTKTLMQCKACGYEWKTQPYIVYNNHGCPNCTNHRQWTETDIRKRVDEVTSGEFKLVGQYTGIHDKTTFLHVKCGRTFQMEPNALINAGQRCPYERRERFHDSASMPVDVFVSTLEKTRRGEYKLVGGYRNSAANAEFIHVKCGTKFVASGSQLLHGGTGCPYCNASKGEEATRNYLNDHGYTFIEQYRIDACRNERPLPFDFALFDESGLTYLIEYQGVQHYQPKWGKENFDIGQIRDRLKLDYCHNHHINLIRIPYKRWSTFEKLSNQITTFLDESLTC